MTEPASSAAAKRCSVCDRPVCGCGADFPKMRDSQHYSEESVCHLPGTLGCTVVRVDWRARAVRAEAERDEAIKEHGKASGFWGSAAARTLARAEKAEAQVEKDARLWEVANASDDRDYLRGAKVLEKLFANQDFDGLPERYRRLLHRDVALMLGERNRFRTAIECVLADLEGNADSRSRGDFTLIETKRIEVLRAALAPAPKPPKGSP